MSTYVATDRELPLDARLEEDTGFAEEGEAVVAVHLAAGDKPLIARNTLDQDFVPAFREILAVPARIVLTAEVRDDWSLAAMVYAEVSTERVVRAKAVLQGETPDSAGAGGAEAGTALVVLGKVVRVRADRKYPDDRDREAADLLFTITSVGARPLVDRVLEDLP